MTHANSAVFTEQDLYIIYRSLLNKQLKCTFFLYFSFHPLLKADLFHSLDLESANTHSHTHTHTQPRSTLGGNMQPCHSIARTVLMHLNPTIATIAARCRVQITRMHNHGPCVTAPASVTARQKKNRAQQV